MKDRPVGGVDLAARRYISGRLSLLSYQKSGIDSGDKLLFHFKDRFAGGAEQPSPAEDCIIVVVMEADWLSYQILYKAPHFQRTAEKTS
jgi:hypothetical protein